MQSAKAYPGWEETAKPPVCCGLSDTALNQAILECTCIPVERHTDSPQTAGFSRPGRGGPFLWATQPNSGSPLSLQMCCKYNRPSRANIATELQSLASQYNTERISKRNFIVVICNSLLMHLHDLVRANNSSYPRSHYTQKTQISLILKVSQVSARGKRPEHV